MKRLISRFRGRKVEPERFTCPRRAENGMDRDDAPFHGAGQNLDTYEPGHGLTDQRHGCSYCGSMPPEDFLAAVLDGVEIGPTDKSYKFYVGTTVRLGKFYTPHLDAEQSERFVALLQGRRINWGYPGYPYTRIYLPNLDQPDLP